MIISIKIGHPPCPRILKQNSGCPSI